MTRFTWDGICQRCYVNASSYTMSMYSTRLICMNCKNEERNRDDYEEAVRAEEEAVRAGNRSFKGIGEPCG